MSLYQWNMSWSVDDPFPLLQPNIGGNKCKDPHMVNTVLELVQNLMAHAHKPHFIFRLNGRVHLNRRGSQFSRPLAAEVCASALVMLDTLRSEVAWEYWLPTPFASFPFTSPPVCHRVPPHSEHSITWWLIASNTDFYQQEREKLIPDRDSWTIKPGPFPLYSWK